ncbi:MAG: ABC transporter ATP-binding protein [Anaerolineae bacterium]|jgi:ATP-binding cassette subfamily B multidrug efflux pump
MTTARGAVAAPVQVRNKSRLFSRLIQYFAPHKARLALVAMLLVISVLMDLVAPYLLGVAVDQFISPTDAARPIWLQLLLSDNVSRYTGLAVVMGLLAISYALAWALNVAQFHVMVRVAQDVLLVMRSQIMEKIQRLSLDFFDRREAGDLMSRLINDTQVINDMFGQGLMRVLRTTLSLVGIVIAMITLNWRLALASYAVLPIILAITIYFSRRVRRAFRETRKTIGEVSAELQENIAGVREVQAFARESENMAEFQAVNERNRSANVQAETLTSMFLPILDVLNTLAVAIVIGFGGYLVLAFSPPPVTVGLIVAFLNYVRRFYEPIRELAELYAQLQSALAGAERVFDLLDTESSVTDAPGAIELPPIQGRLTYENVSFHYKEGEPVLQDVSVTIEPGQTVALVGPTGAGKTTMANLLIRFYDAVSGTICIDGYSIYDVTLDSLRRQIGVVPQDTYLFSGKIIDNIRYGRLDATDEEVIEAARLANAHDFIQRLPDGYNTVIGERGVGLSQGNRQLLAIARAILKDPRILILDEATSSVDTRTELLIQRALNTLMQGRTSLVIAHRLSTIRNADQILVIHGGRIAERGDHASLLAQKGLYYNLYMSQFRREVDAPSAPSAPAAISP